MGLAQQWWERLVLAFEQQDVEALLDLYAPGSVFLEPHNPPHEGNLLIQAYLSSWLQAREEISIATRRQLESPEGSTLAVEWTVSYTAGGRRWQELPRSSWLDVDDDGIQYHRDYY